MLNYKIYIDITEKKSANMHFMLDKTFSIISASAGNAALFIEKFGYDDDHGIRQYIEEFQIDFESRMYDQLRHPATIMASYCSNRYTKVSAENLEKIKFWEVVRSEIGKHVEFPTVHVQPAPEKSPPRKKSRSGVQFSLDSSDEEEPETELAQRVARSSIEEFENFDLDSVVAAEMEAFDKIDFQKEDKRNDILLKWKRLRKGKGRHEFPNIMKADRDALVISAGNGDAETTFSFCTINTSYLKTQMSIGTLISEVYCKLTAGKIDTDGKVPDIKNYARFDGDFNGTRMVEIDSGEEEIPD